MAPTRLKRNIAILDVLSKAPKNQRDAIINTATRDQISCICDCANNILKENIPLSPSELKTLKRHQELIRHLAQNKSHRDINQKKKYIVQAGGFLPALLAPVLGALGSILVETLIKRK